MDIDLLELQPGEEVFEEYFTDTEGLLGELDSEPVIQELDKNEPEVLRIPERQKIVFEVPSLTVDAPKPSVHERLGPRVGQNASSSKEKEWLSPEEWEVFRAERKKGRKENRKLKEQAVLSRAKPRKRTLPEMGPSVSGFRQVSMRSPITHLAQTVRMSCLSGNRKKQSPPSQTNLGTLFIILRSVEWSLLFTTWP